MKILNVDSSILNTIQNCARKAQYSHIYNLQPHEKDEALEKGDLMHKMLETYYSLHLDNGPDMESGLWQELVQLAGITPSMSDPVQVGIQAGIYFASMMSIPSTISEEVVDQFQAYCEFYRHDEWHPIAVEEVGSKIMYQDNDLTIVYNFKIDLIAERGRTIMPWDHKTGSRRHTPSSLSNQFIGYCYALGANYIMINKIGFQKSLKPAERFQRFPLPIASDRIQEWVENSIHWAVEYSRHQDDNYFPMNFTSCDKYSGCIFQHICEADPETRATKMERDFVQVEPWDVAKALESRQE